MGVSKKFDLDSSILGPNSSSSLELSGATDADVVRAISADSRFPDRASGEISLGRIALKAESSKDVVFNAGKAKVNFGFSSTLEAGIGVYDNPDHALATLALVEAPGLDLTLADSATTKFLLMKLGYAAEGNVEGSHPLGVVGSVTFGVQGSGRSLMAVLHRFDQADGAGTVMARTVQSWRLPRHVAKGTLASNTWVIADLEGSLAMKVGAKVGYDFNFVHEARLGGLTGDIGLKIDASIKATLGFDVSAKFLAVVGREGTDEKVRLRLFKQKKNGMNFGLNLNVGVTTEATFLPGTADEFVQAVFGVHGGQVVKALKELEKWTDKNKSVGDLVAGLTNEKALELIQSATGMLPAQLFDKGKQKLVGVIAKWDALPDTASATVWGLLGKLDRKTTTALTDALTILAGNDPDAQRAKIREILSGVDLLDKPEAQWLTSLAETGAIELLNRLDHVRDVAQQTLDVLDGDMLRNLKASLEEALGLDKVIKAVKAADFNKLDSLLVGRLSMFLDKELKFENLNEIKDAINTVITKRQEIYAKVRKALNSRHSVDLAVAFQKATAKEALIDVEFDLADSAAAALFKSVIQDAAYDTLFVDKASGVKINSAVMSHGITRSSSVELNLPMFNFRSDHENNSLAKVRASDLTVEEEAGRLLVYDLSAKDEVRVRRQYKSKLLLALTDEITRKSGVRVSSARRGTWSYQLLYAKANMKREELEGFTRPFIEEYMADQFTGGTDLSTFYRHFDTTVEGIVGNGANEFGDVLTSMEVAIPGSALEGWLKPRKDDERKAAAMDVSRRIQAGVKRLLPHYFFQDVNRLRQNASAAALLVWAAVRPCTSVNFLNGSLTFNTDKDVYWNFPDDPLRRAMATNPDTAARLAPALASARLRLQEAGEHKEASFFVPSEAGDFLALAADGAGSSLFRTLVQFEAELVRKAAEALNDLKGLTQAQDAKASDAIAKLAEFGADITTAFNEKLDSVYADKSALRALGQVVFLEASRALDRSLAATKPIAMLTMIVLKETRTFQLDTFLTGAQPDQADVAVAQRLVTT